MLGHSDADSVEADARPDGLFNLAFVEGDIIRDATKPVNAAELRAILTGFHGGGKGWRGLAKWQAPSAKAAPALPIPLFNWSRLRVWIPIIAPAVAVIALLLGYDLSWFSWSSGFSFDPADIPMPAMFDSVASRMFLLLFVACVLLFLVALIVKAVETRMVSRWPSVQGTIIRSQRGIATRAMQNEMPTDVRTADIAYSFKVKGKDYIGTKVSLAERVDESEIPALLERYKVGQPVKVYYKRDNPQEALLDREAPKGLLGGCLLILVIGFGVLLAASFVFTHGGEYIIMVLPRSNPPLLIIPLLVGLGFLLAFLGVRRSLGKAKSFPRVDGVVTDSEIVTFEKRSTRERNNRTQVRYTTMYSPRVAYRYEVGGQSYVNRRVIYGTDEAGSQSFAQGVVARYPMGTKVSVLYNPEKPEDAGLEIKTGWTWLLLVAAVIALSFAFLFTGILDLPALRPKP